MSPGVDRNYPNEISVVSPGLSIISASQHLAQTTFTNDFRRLRRQRFYANGATFPIGNPTDIGYGTERSYPKYRRIEVHPVILCVQCVFKIVREGIL